MALGFSGQIPMSGSPSYNSMLTSSFQRNIIRKLMFTLEIEKRIRAFVKSLPKRKGTHYEAVHRQPFVDNVWVTFSSFAALNGGISRLKNEYDEDRPLNLFCPMHGPLFS